jgi:hypothetical protein
MCEPLEFALVVSFQDNHGITNATRRHQTWQALEEAGCDRVAIEDIRGNHHFKAGRAAWLHSAAHE